MSVRKRHLHLYPLPEKHYEYLEELLYTPLKYKENSILMTPPLYGRDHEVNNLIGRIKERAKILLNNLGSYRLGFVNLASTSFKSDTIWLEQIERALSISKGSIDNFDLFSRDINILLQEVDHISLFINIPETLTDEYFLKFLSMVQKIYYINSSRIHFQLVFDMRWEENVFFKLTTPFRSLFQNTKLLSLFSDKEVEYFVNYFCAQWNLALPNTIKKYIIEQSGGVLLLAKSALRVIRNEKIKKLDLFQNIITSNVDHKLQINFFLSRLTEHQQALLKSLANGKEIKDEELSHMERMGILQFASKGFHIRSKFIHNYLQEKASSISRKIKLTQSYQGLSDREKKILICLMQKPGVIVSRDSIAKILWESQSYEKYSDWAIDQAISRIRKKIILVPFFSNTVIQTHKKLGFSLK